MQVDDKMAIRKSYLRRKCNWWTCCCLFVSLSVLMAVLQIKVTLVRSSHGSSVRHTPKFAYASGEALVFSPDDERVRENARLEMKDETSEEISLTDTDRLSLVEKDYDSVTKTHRSIVSAPTELKGHALTESFTADIEVTPLHLPPVVETQGTKPSIAHTASGNQYAVNVSTAYTVTGGNITEMNFESIHDDTYVHHKTNRGTSPEANSDGESENQAFDDDARTHKYPYPVMNLESLVANDPDQLAAALGVQHTELGHRILETLSEAPTRKPIQTKISQTMAPSTPKLNVSRSASLKSNSTDNYGKSSKTKYVSLPMSSAEVTQNMQGLKFTMPQRGKHVSEQWQVMEDPKEVYLLSAYFDDRPGLTAPVVRIIGIVEGNATVLHCLHWYDSQANPDVVMAELTQVGPYINPVDATRYGQYLLTCGLVPNKQPPVYVSVVSPESSATSTLLLVQWPVKTDSHIEFGLCMSVLYWQHDPFRLVEWLELMRMWGIGEVTVYNNSLDAVSSMILQHYSLRERFVDLRQISNALKDDGELTILMNMSPVINDCMYRNLYRYKYISSVDLDEMIVPRMHTNYSDMLKAIKDKQSPDQDVMSYMFRNVYFFDDLGPAKHKPWFLWTTRYLRHILPSSFGYSVKSFTNPQTCIGLQNHLCWKKMPKYENMTTWNIDVTTSLGMNHHYKKCHFDTFLEKNGVCHKMMKEYREDPSMLRFEKVISEKVIQKLIELDMVEKVTQTPQKPIVPTQ